MLLKLHRLPSYHGETSQVFGTRQRSSAANSLGRIGAAALMSAAQRHREACIPEADPGGVVSQPPLFAVVPKVSTGSEFEVTVVAAAAGWGEAGLRDERDIVQSPVRREVRIRQAQTWEKHGHEAIQEAIQITRSAFRGYRPGHGKSLDGSSN